jgi:hypothetical protein
VTAAATSAPDWLVVGGLVFMAVYLLALIVFDRCLSTRPSRDLLLRFAQSLRRGAGHRGHVDPATAAQLERDIDRLVSWVPRGRVISVTRVLSSWRFAHELERRTWVFATGDEVRRRLDTAQQELAALADATGDDIVAAAMSNEIRRLLHGEPADPKRSLVVTLGRWQLSWRGRPAPGADTENALRACLQQALRLLQDRRDTRFESLADLQTKSVWLAVLGIALILIASVTAGREAFFVFGALGAFVSRLGRLLRRKPSEYDYGASSGALYLSPVAGAIAGWLGVLLVSALADSNVNVLGSAFSGIWDNPGLLAFAVATVSGFSERVLNRVLQEAGETISATGGGSSAGGKTG